MSISKANIQAGRAEWYIVAFYVEFWALACTVADGNDSRALHCPNYDSTGAMHYYSFLCDGKQIQQTRFGEKGEEGGKG